MPRILIVDDDVTLTDMVREYLEPEGFEVSSLHEGRAATSTDLRGVDLIVLDVMLPGQSGLEVLRKLRRSSSIPVIMLTARTGEVDRIVGLEIGADDYVPKPVNPRELLARIRAVLRRGQRGGEAAAEIAVGDIRLDSGSRDAWLCDRKIDLTTAEFNLLEHLLHNAGRVVARDELSAAAFGRQASLGGADRNVDTLVSKVRRKLGRAEGTAQRIKTVRNVGYILAQPSTAAADRPARPQATPPVPE